MLSDSVDHELQLVLLGGDEISECSRFWLGECFGTWPVVTAKFGLVLFFLWFPIDSIVTVEICSRVFFSTLVTVCWVVVLSLVENLAL